MIKVILLRIKVYEIWGLGIGDWGLGIGDWGLGPIPNPQSPIPINLEKILLYKFYFFLIISFKLLKTIIFYYLNLFVFFFHHFIYFSISKIYSKVKYISSFFILCIIITNKISNSFELEMIQMF